MTNLLKPQTNEFLFLLMIVLLYSFLLVGTGTEALSSPKPSSSSSFVTIRVCTGSSCLGKCRGAFNPLKSFQNLKDDDDADDDEDHPSPIEIEETYCMNQCKKGPNARIIQDGSVLIFKEQMNEMEQKRKSFQGIVSENRVEALWGLAKGVQCNDESVVSTNTGTSVEKLTDIMPAKVN